jgi:hypothetical protein
MRSILRLSLLAVLAPAFVTANADVVTLDFEGFDNMALLETFYMGGTDNHGNSGPNYGIDFDLNAYALVDKDWGNGGTGYFANEPSPSTVMLFQGSSTVLDYSAGFTGNFSFFYSSSVVGSVKIYSGLDATGHLIATIPLADQYNANHCTGDPTGLFCNWTDVGVAVSETARSVEFGGAADRTMYDNVTFGGPLPLPEPGTGVLSCLGLALLCAARSPRKSQQRT